jgi:hypothetical protein
MKTYMKPIKSALDDREKVYERCQLQLTVDDYYYYNKDIEKRSKKDPEDKRGCIIIDFSIDK